MFRFGLKDTYSNGTAAIGMDINATPADIRISGLGESNVAVGTTQDGLFHTYTTAITKTAVANTFDLSISFDNVEAASYTIVNSALYGATKLFPVLDTQSGGNKGGALVDSFSRTVAVPVPEPSAFAVMFGTLALAAAVARRKRTQA